MGTSTTGHAPSVSLSDDQFQVLFAGFLAMNEKLDALNQRSASIDNQVALQHDFAGKDAAFMGVVQSYFTNRETLSSARIQFETAAPSFVKPRKPEDMSSVERQQLMARLEQQIKDLKLDKTIDPTSKSKLVLEINRQLEVLEELEQKDQLFVKF